MREMHRSQWNSKRLHRYPHWSKAKTMGIKERTLADILRKFIDLKLIRKVTHGVYVVR